MKHRSTRGASAPLGFLDAALRGLAPDGGLYVPEAWPHFDPSELRSFAGMRYADVATRVIGRLAGGDLRVERLARMVEDAYAGFRHPAIAPLVQLDSNLHLLELFHGPTLAFKDVAMQWLARLMDSALRQKGERATIVVATSGDTGNAAAEAFAGLEAADLFILYPHGRVSEVQRRQMTTAAAPNVHALAIDGTFDDCQRIVKSLFADSEFRDGVRLSGVNSINWARIVAQSVYYISAAVALGAPDRPLSFAVPTGNFGDIFAGYVAKRMGLPIDRLIVATNTNDILARTLATGRYELGPVHATTSPSMDIQVSSNFERLLFEAGGRDSVQVAAAMEALGQTGGFTLTPDVLAIIRHAFAARAVSEAEVTLEIANTYRDTGVLLDPHSAIGVHAARASLRTRPNIPIVALATAHPSKFPDAVESATGVRPPLPAHLADLLNRDERVHRLPGDPQAIASFIRTARRTLS